MILRSFVLRLSQILAVTVAICMLIMAATAFLQELVNLGIAYSVIAGGALLYVLILHFVIRQIDPELIVEVARLLYPSAAILSILISLLLGFELYDNLEHQRYQQVPVILAGVLIALFLAIRCFDIKWLRSADEIILLKQAARGRKREDL